MVLSNTVCVHCNKCILVMAFKAPKPNAIIKMKTVLSDGLFPKCLLSLILLFPFNIAIVITTSVSSARANLISDAKTSTEAPGSSANSPNDSRTSIMKELLFKFETLFKENDFTAAAKIMQRILALIEDTYGSNHPYTASGIDGLARVIALQGRYKEAVPLFERALAIREATLSHDSVDIALGLQGLGQVLQRLGRYKEAEIDYKRAEFILVKHLGPDNSSVASILSDMASLSHQIHNYQQAESLYRRAISIRENAVGRDAINRSMDLAGLGSLYAELARFEEAEKLLTQATVITTKLLGENSIETATIKEQLGRLYIAQGKYELAEPLFVSSLAFFEGVFGRDHLQIVQSLKGNGDISVARAEYNKAEALYKRASSIQEKYLGANAMEVVRTMTDISAVYREQGRLNDARSMLQQILVKTVASQGSESAETASVMNNLALIYSDLGNLNDSEQLVNRAIVIIQHAYGQNHPATAEFLSNLGNILFRQGRYADALLTQKRVLDIRIKTFGVDSLIVAQSLNNISLIYSKQGLYREASKILERSLGIFERILGPYSVNVATVADNLGAMYIAMGRRDEGLAMKRRSLDVRRKVLGSDHPSTAESLNNIAMSSHAQLGLDERESYLIEALRIYEKNFGQYHFGVAQILNSLGQLYALQGRDKDAKDVFYKSMVVSEKALGVTHPQSIEAAYDLALYYLLQNDARSAYPIIEKLSRNQTDWLLRELPLQPRALRFKQLEAQPDSVGITFALLALDSRTAPLAMELRLNRQGLLAEIEQRQRLLQASSTDTRKMGDRLADYDRQLASVTLTPLQRQELSIERQQLESELNVLLPSLRIAPVRNQDVINALKRLSKNGLLIEFQKYKPYQRQGVEGVWGENHYLALTLNSDGRITVVPLGLASDIDKLISKASDASAQGLIDAPELWHNVSQKLIGPLTSQISGTRELFISPDSELNRVPFAALPWPLRSNDLLSLSQRKDQFLVDSFNLRILTTGRDLVHFLGNNDASNASVVVANPAYDLAINHSGLSKTQSSLLTVGDKQLPESEATRVWRLLPGTEKEGNYLAPLLHAGEPITGVNASAARVLSIRSPQILHIATHGFFNPTVENKPSTTPMLRIIDESNSRSVLNLLASVPSPPNDPLVQSGLVMAGANFPEADSQDDGYLTASEVIGMDLKGTELVTLSACDTARGHVMSGEGVYGLQRSLSVAGSRSTLLTLWKVDDEATRVFMGEFYRRLIGGESRADALRNAQLMLRRHPNLIFRDIAAWGAFQLTGDWRPLKVK